MRTRLLRTTIGLVLVTVLVLGIPLTLVSGFLVSDGVRSSIAVRAESIAAALSEQLVDTDTIDLSAVAGSVPPGWRLEVRSADGAVDAIGAPDDGSLVSVSLPSPGGTLVLASPPDELRTARWRAYGLVAGAVLLSLVVGVGIARITASRLVSPLSVLTERAARLGAGDFRTSAQRFGIAELDRVAEVLDATALQVAGMLQGERELASDVSHQLRTRLTGIQLRLDELASHPDPAVRSEIEHALQQTDRLVGVVNDLLATARSRRAASASALDLDAELAEVAASWKDTFAVVSRPLEVTGDHGLSVRATPVRLREALGVLLDNSLQHGAGPVVVHVEERVGQGLVLVEVTDAGPGIADPLVPHVFDRGVSGASSSGLGLGLARAFVEADGGRLELRRPRPATFGIFLAAAGDGSPVTAPLSPA
ncbi:ATP-binding protein [Nakamurella deserti]|uniref:ATP-binding protein n=1 Tax=Nakamurella deserti TaxID=2164074 RepID=UPI000DBE739B|nr:ATP-binding protein [Nakamurella deserti]